MNSSQPIRIVDVANYFLYKSVPSSPRSLTHTKLQKLCYFAQGRHLVLHDGKSLFPEELYAREIGPASPVLSQLYEKYGYYTLDSVEEMPSIFRSELEAKYILDDVWKQYGHLDAKLLEELSHMEFPWLLTKKNERITKEIMHTYFKESMKEL